MSGDIIVVFNEARGFEHLDFDSILLIRSTDGGRTWDSRSRRTVWPCTHHYGSDTPSIAELSDGSLMVNYVQRAFVNRKGIDTDLGPQHRVVQKYGGKTAG